MIGWKWKPSSFRSLIAWRASSMASRPLAGSTVPHAWMTLFVPLGKAAT